MKHAFLLNMHRDEAQARRLCLLLKKHRPKSNILIYYDGPEVGPSLYTVESNFYAKYEENKAKSLINFYNMLFSAATGYDMVSFLHSDMIPTDWQVFERFLERFMASGKALVHSSLFPNHHWIDACNLHFNVENTKRLCLFPVQYGPLPYGWQDCNEAQITHYWDTHKACWRDHGYHLWTMVMPYTSQFSTIEGQIVKIGHTIGHDWIIHNYTPETSVVHSDDEAFWKAYPAIVR